MKVILLKDVRNVGRKYELKEVADGFAMNSLIPQGLAQIASGAALKRVEAQKQQDDKARVVREGELQKNLKSIENVSVSLSGKANEQGHLFAGIHTDELSKALKEQANLNIEPEYIDLEKPLKEVGEHKVRVKVGEKSAEFTVNIEAK